MDGVIEGKDNSLPQEKKQLHFRIKFSCNLLFVPLHNVVNFDDNGLCNSSSGSLIN